VWRRGAGLRRGRAGTEVGLGAANLRLNQQACGMKSCGAGNTKRGRREAWRMGAGTVNVGEAKAGAGPAPLRGCDWACWYMVQGGGGPLSEGRRWPWAPRSLMAPLC
jgi:hypothetical protein